MLLLTLLVFVAVMDFCNLFCDGDLDEVMVGGMSLAFLAWAEEREDPARFAFEPEKKMAEVTPARSTPANKKAIIRLKMRGETAQDLAERNLDLFQDPDVYPGASKVYPFR